MPVYMKDALFKKGISLSDNPVYSEMFHILWCLQCGKDIGIVMEFGNINRLEEDHRGILCPLCGGSGRWLTIFKQPVAIIIWDEKV